MEKPKPKTARKGQEKIRKSLLADLEQRTPEERLAHLRRNASGSVADKPQPKSIQAYQEANRQAMVKNREQVARMTHEELVAQFRRNAAMPTIHDDVKILLYLVFAMPKPGSKKYGIVSRYDGYFLCLADNPDPTHLLSELLAKKDAEILLAHRAATGEIGCLRGGVVNRDQIIEHGYALVLEKTIRFSPSKN